MTSTKNDIVLLVDPDRCAMTYPEIPDVQGVPIQTEKQTASERALVDHENRKKYHPAMRRRGK